MSVRQMSQVTTGAADFYFFDANVWLSIFPARSAKIDKWAPDCTAFFDGIQNGHGNVMVNALVIGEYVNRFCRIEHEAYQTIHQTTLKYKEYRSLPDFKDVAEAAAMSVREIIESPEISQEGILSGDVDIAKGINIFEDGRSDINDLFFVQICRKNGWTLVTNDADFRRHKDEIDIVTCNPKLIWG